MLLFSAVSSIKEVLVSNFFDILHYLRDEQNKLSAFGITVAS